MKPLSSSEDLVDNKFTNSMTIEKSKDGPSCRTTSATWNRKFVNQTYRTSIKISTNLFHIIVAKNINSCTKEYKV